MSLCSISKQYRNIVEMVSATVCVYRCYTRGLKSFCLQKHEWSWVKHTISSDITSYIFTHFSRPQFFGCHYYRKTNFFYPKMTINNPLSQENKGETASLVIYLITYNFHVSHKILYRTSSNICSSTVLPRPVNTL